MGRIKLIKDPGFTAATRQTVDVQGLTLWHVKLGDLRVRIWFGVLAGLAVVVLLGTKFIVKFVTGTFPLQLKVVPHQSKPVEIIQKDTTTRCSMKLHDKHDQTNKNYRTNEEEVDEGKKDPKVIVKVA